MKTTLILLLINLPGILFSQNKSLVHTWYTENTVVNNLKKKTITLTQDSITRKVGTNKCTEIYCFQKDSTFYQSMWSVPESSAESVYMLSGYGTYSDGKWIFISPGQLVLVSTVNNKIFRYEYTLQWISDSRVVLTEK